MIIDLIIIIALAINPQQKQTIGTEAVEIPLIEAENYVTEIIHIEKLMQILIFWVMRSRAMSMMMMNLMLILMMKVVVF